MKLTVIVYAAVAVALSEGTSLPNRQKRQEDDPTTTTEDPSTNPSTTTEDGDTTTTIITPTTTLPTTTSSSTTTSPSSTNTSTTVPPPSSSETPGPPYLPPTEPPSNHSGYDYPPPPIPFTYPPYGKIQPQNYWSNSNWQRKNEQNTQKWSWNQPTNNWNAWMNNLPYGNSPNTWNQLKNSISQFWGTPKSNGGWKPTFGPYGNNNNYGQWQLNKPQINTPRWANSYSPNINRQLGQRTNTGNHFGQTNNKGGLWSNWFNLF